MNGLKGLVIASAAGLGLLLGGTAAAAGQGEVKLPAFEQTTLPNGTRIALVPKRDTPLVDMVVLVRGGSLADAPGREGTASLLAEVMEMFRFGALNRWKKSGGSKWMRAMSP